MKDNVPATYTGLIEKPSKEVNASQKKHLQSKYYEVTDRTINPETMQKVNDEKNDQSILLI